MAFFDDGEYFNSNVDGWLDYYDISFYEDSSETLREMYLSSPCGGDMSIVFDENSLKKGDHEKNIKELERQIYKYCQNDLDDICEPYIEQYMRDKSYYADCGITSYQELIDDIKDWRNTLIDFDNRLLGEIKNLEKDYSKEKFFWLKNTRDLTHSYIGLNAKPSYSNPSYAFQYVRKYDEDLPKFKLQVEETVNTWNGSETRKFTSKTNDMTFEDCLEVGQNVSDFEYFIDENLDLVSFQYDHDGGNCLTFREIDDKGEVKPLGQKVIDSLNLPDDVLERWEQFKSTKVSRVEELERSEPEIESPAEVARKAKEKANKQNANSVKSIDKNKSVKR